MRNLIPAALGTQKNNIYAKKKCMMRHLSTETTKFYMLEGDLMQIERIDLLTHWTVIRTGSFTCLFQPLATLLNADAE